MSALLSTAPEAEKPVRVVLSHRMGSAVKLVTLALVLGGLMRLAFLDPLGIGAATASFLGNDRATVTGVVMVQFKQDIGHEAIDYTRERMVNLQYSCAHPYTGNLYIGGLSIGGPPDGFDREHHHVFWFRFRSNDEKDFFMNQDPAFKAVKKDVEPFVQGYIILGSDDGKDDDKKDPA
ncbi:hypothetical protein B0T16DRAFT_458912 [Cercophora newfieldiana]|uniref:Stress-response A/B barrel domain-containing protein n=1 Tax=Cercophora newfieldiana TaxID=92897 RepID=A0AA40CRR1_9PEZI|nr:hypothetical protein B0T16DRAFT_458912 [Cercophora newfieldiana]